MQHTPPFEAFRTIKFALAALLALAAIATFSSPGNAAVFGADDRRALDAASAALSEKIGTLTSQKTGVVCTAFCVAPDIIATASHCLFGTAASHGPRLSALRFNLGTDGKRVSAISGTQNPSYDRSIISGTRQLAVAPPIGAAQDWAVTRLERPLCTSGGVALSNRSQGEIDAAAARGEIYQIAVHADLPGAKLRISRPCAVRKEFPNASRAALARDFMAFDKIVFHDCDTGGGSSGSPLLVDTPRGPEAVAMNVGTYVMARSVPSARVADDASPDAGSEALAKQTLAKQTMAKQTLANDALANTAITLHDLPKAIEVLSQRDTLTSDTDVRHIQSLLRDAGFYKGPLNGDATNDTRLSVRRFNGVYGRAISARLTLELAADLEAWLRDRTPDQAMP